MLGSSAMARITSVGRWSVFGEVIETFSFANRETQSREETKPPCSSNVSTCETCTCSAESCGEERSGEACNISGNISRQEDDHKGKSKKEEKEMQEEVVIPRSSVANWGFIDKALVCGVFVSSLTILVLLISIACRVLLRQ